jgi:flagellar biogenesis protein FliO
MTSRKRGVFAWLLCIALLMTIATWDEAFATAAIEAPAAIGAGERKPLQFKPEPSVTDPGEAKVWIALVVLLALAVPALYWLRKKHPMFGAISGGSAKLRVIEMRPVGPRLTLYLIEVKGEEILLAQGGDSVVQIAIGGQRLSSSSRIPEDLQAPLS